jgi:hypothetical protein
MILGKAIDGLTFTTSLTAGDIPVISLGFTQYENFDTEENTWDSQNLFEYLCAIENVSFSFIGDVDNEMAIQLGLTMGNSTLNFSNGEYFNLDGTQYNIASIKTELISALGL